MARITRPPRQYTLQRDDIERRLIPVVDQRDPEATVYVNVTAMGAIHIILVSDILAAIWGGEHIQTFWDVLEDLLTEDEMERLFTVQVLSVQEALRLHGPLDAHRLLEIGRELETRWATAIRPQPEAGLLRLPLLTNELLETLKHWALACRTVLATSDEREIANHSSALLEAREGTSDLLEQAPVLNLVGERIRSVIRALEQLTATQRAA